MRLVALILFFASLGASFAETPEKSEQTEFARDFYNSYLDSLPDQRKARRAVLQANLLKTLKRIIPKEDPIEGSAVADTLRADELLFMRVDRSDPYVRGIFKEVPNLKEEEFMYIVRFRDYIAFVCYRADPLKFRVDETSNYMVVRKRPADESSQDTENEKQPNNHSENLTQ